MLALAPEPTHRLGVDESDILEVLLDLAESAGFQVRPGGQLGPDDPPLASGVCRLRGQLFVVLSANESVPMQIDTLAGALREHASSLLESQHLPPAVRAVLDPAGRESFGSA